MRVLGNRVFIKFDQEENKTESGIILAKKEQGKPIKGVVFEVGNGVGSVKKGDLVLFNKYIPDEIEVNKDKYLVCEESDLIAILDYEQEK